MLRHRLYSFIWLIRWSENHIEQIIWSFVRAFFMRVYQIIKQGKGIDIIGNFSIGICYELN
jgi:hypothetical protein